MRRQLSSVLFRIAADRRANVLTTFALSALPALFVAGAAVDYSRSVTQWTNLQQATDATALTVAHNYLNASSTADNLKSFAQSYINGLMNGATITTVTLQQSNTVVCVSASYAVPTVLMKMVKDSLTVSNSSCSQVGNTYEVALALDNSTSMSETDTGGVSKISSLQSAAKKLVDILIPANTTNPSTAISIVPFASMVNVGATAGSGNTVPAFIDTAGTAVNHWQNFHRPSTKFKPTSKLDLFATLTNGSTGTTEKWGGCVEERPYPNVTTDISAQSSSPDSMFVPYFSPDEPGDVDTSSGVYPGTSCYPQKTYFCTKDKNAFPSYAYVNSYLTDNGSGSVGGTCSQDSNYASYDNASTPSDGQPNLFPGSSLSMVCKYQNASFTPMTAYDTFKTGPNHYCTTSQLLPLTTSSSTLTTFVNGSLKASGTTNLAAGFMWAWRTLSNLNATVGSTTYPLYYPVTSPSATGPQNPKPYGYSPPQNTKVIILMTDGTNTWLNNGGGGNLSSTYDAFGYYGNKRLDTYLTQKSTVTGDYDCGSTSVNSNAVARCVMDNATLEACSNAKKKGVIVYTIGFSVPSDPIDSDGQNLLKNCASSASKYFPATDSASIQTAFQQIAASILTLRLSQ